MKEDFNLQLHDQMSEGFFDEGYPLFGHAMRVGAKKVGTVEGSALPEWKQVNQDRLAELSVLKKRTAQKAPQGVRSAEFKRVAAAAKKEVRQMINKWWREKAAYIQERVDAKDHNHQFAGYRELRRVLAHGRKQPDKLRDEKGNLLHTRTGRIKRWREYFKDLLNVPAQVAEESQLDRVSEIVPQRWLDELPSFAETVAAVDRLKTGKAPGPDGIEAELLLALDGPNLRTLHEMFCRVWEGLEPIPEDWKFSYLVPVPKKGDLTQCKRWRGILLSSIPGKVFARILNARLTSRVEDMNILPESQCGFRAGRGTLDMICALKIAMEIADYKRHPFHVLFVDLVKAYDSVSRTGLWEILRKKGVPWRMGV